MARRDKSIKIPVSESELHIIRSKAESEHLSMATYLRNLGMKKQENKNLNNFLAGESSEERLKREYYFFVSRVKKYTSKDLAKEWYISDYKMCYKLSFELLEKAVRLGYDISNWEEIKPIEEVK